MTTSATAMIAARRPLSIESWPRLGPMLCDFGDAQRNRQRAGAQHEREVLRVGEIDLPPIVICPRVPIALWMTGGRPITRSSRMIAM